jgi:preprotein translocase subunit YajC
VNPIVALLGAQPADGSNPLTGTLFMFVAIGAIFYFLILRPQRQQQKQHEAMVQSLSRGDEVVTLGGVIGKIVHVADDRLVIKSGDTRIEVERGKIGRKLGAGEKGSADK